MGAGTEQEEGNVKNLMLRLLFPFPLLPWALVGL